MSELTEGPNSFANSQIVTVVVPYVVWIEIWQMKIHSASLYSCNCDHYLQTMQATEMSVGTIGADLQARQCRERSKPAHYHATLCTEDGKYSELPFVMSLPCCCTLMGLSGPLVF